MTMTKSSLTMQATDVIGSIGPVQSSTLTFPGGAKMPLIGFGTYKVDKADSVRYEHMLTL